MNNNESQIKYYTIRKESEECQCISCRKELKIGNVIYVSGLGNWYCSRICYEGKCQDQP